MTDIEVGKYLVELFSNYERYADKLGYSSNQKYSEAVSMAIMALKAESMKDDKR